MKKQIHVYYSGRVQGVGFRFTIRQIAHELELYGWVKNLRDGTVELIVEGEEEFLKDFLAKVQLSFSRYIHDVDTQWLPASGEFNDFRIAF